MNKLLVKLFVFFLLSCSSVAYAEQLRFVQFTDVHLSSSGSDYYQRNLEQSVELLEKAINSVNSIPNINFIAFSGDNIDEPSDCDLETFCEITRKLNKAYYIGIGNHDVFGMGFHKGLYFDTVRKYNKNQKNKNGYYYFTPNKDFVVIFMDGVIQAVPTSHGCYTEEDLDWLDQVLTKNKNKKAIIIQHFPLVEPKENKSHRLRRIEDYFDVINKHNNVIMVASGHYHTDKVTLKDGIYHISTPAFVETPYSYRIIEINYNKKELFADTPKFEIKTELIPLCEQKALQN